MNLMTWLTGKNTGGAGEKRAVDPARKIKLPVYPASHYKKKLV